MASMDIRGWVFIQSPASGRHSQCCFVALVPMDEKWRSGAVISVCVQIEFTIKSYAIGQFVGLLQFTVHVILKLKWKRVNLIIKFHNLTQHLIEKLVGIVELFLAQSAFFGICISLLAHLVSVELRALIAILNPIKHYFHRPWHFKIIMYVHFCAYVWT